MQLCLSRAGACTHSCQGSELALQSRSSSTASSLNPQLKLSLSCALLVNPKQAFGEALKLQKLSAPAFAEQLLSPGLPALTRGGAKSRGRTAADAPVAAAHTALLNLVSSFLVTETNP